MENKIKNRIIAISGEPVSGKGTTIKKMTELLTQNGYKKETLAVESYAVMLKGKIYQQQVYDQTAHLNFDIKHDRHLLVAIFQSLANIL